MADNNDFPDLEKAMQVEGSLIAFEFTLSLEGGEVIDSNVEGEPMVFQTGVGEMLPAVEEALLTMQAGESREIVVAPEQGYGPITDEAHREFPLQAIPEEARQAGRKVMARAPNGEENMVDVISVSGDMVVLDFNHPLAGKTLYFALKVLSSETLG